MIGSGYTYLASSGWPLVKSGTNIRDAIYYKLSLGYLGSVVKGVIVWHPGWITRDSHLISY